LSIAAQAATSLTDELVISGTEIIKAEDWRIINYLVSSGCESCGGRSKRRGAIAWRHWFKYFSRAMILIAVNGGMVFKRVVGASWKDAIYY
jgi:hypothetical protein